MSNIVIRVDKVNKFFELPHERHSSIKSLFVNILKSKRTYEKQHVLKDISFEIEEGDFFAIVGRNGSGKSTLLKLLAGIYRTEAGSITVNGKLTPFIELGVGFNPELSGKDNIFMNGALLGFNRKEVHAMYDDIVEFAELERFMDQKLKNYSSGMQVRLAFSIAIRARSDILLLDEVLAVGDAAFQQKCFDYFETLKADKKTVVFVSHDMSAVTRFCNKAVYIKDGKLVRRGSPSEIAEMYKLENIEVPKVIKVKQNKGPQLSAVHAVTTKITHETPDKLHLTFSYTSEDDKDMYIGFSVLRDGISIAELTTSLDKPLVGSGAVSYIMDVTAFNEGVYQITTVLCRKDGRKLLSISRAPLTFKVRGHDLTRGAALKLADAWDYK